jgi:RNA polymerase sigma factor (sigma-70 family)
MKRKPETPESADASPPAFAAGWASPAAAPTVPLESMQVTPAAPAWPVASHPVAESPGTTVALAPPSIPIAPDDLASGNFDIAGPVSTQVPPPIIASALLDEPQQEGLAYLLNYAGKSIRRNRTVSEQDRDDLLHEIYMEWWVCVGFEVAALPKLLDAESPARRSLRESIYRVFGRYRYQQSAHRTQDLAEGDTPDPHTLSPEETRDFALDLENWLRGLPELEARIIDLYYFQHKTMEEIGVELGLAKQRISEIHKRALARHPDGV